MTSIPLDLHSKTAVQYNVLTLFKRFGSMDDYQLIERYIDEYGFVAESTPRTRRRELADMGLLVATGAKTFSVSGRSLTVWSPV